MHDVIIVGAGVTGASIARELSRYALDLLVLEAQADVSMGASRANSAIVHAGYDCPVGSLMAKYNVQGNAMMEDQCRELDVPFKRTGTYVLAFDDKDREQLQVLYDRGLQNGVPGLEIITGDAMRGREPKVSAEVVAALYASTGGITCPYQLTLALMENAVTNGVHLKRNWKVASIRRENGCFVLENDRGEEERSRFLVNAAGLYADEINTMAGGKPFTIRPRKGEYILLDRTAGQIVKSVLFQTPSAMGKGVLVSPTVDGNVFTGPTAEDITDKQDRATTADGMEDLKKMALRSVTDLPVRQSITAFSGLRAQVEGMHDFIIGPEADVPGFVNAAGICSPGLTSAPAIGVAVSEILGDIGLKRTNNSNFSPRRIHAKPFREMTFAERKEAIAQDARNGRIICRCETVTEAEIIRALHGPVPAATLDGVKRRTRAGMGRCQGGFCSPRVMEIMSRELNLKLEELTKDGGESFLVYPK